MARASEYEPPRDPSSRVVTTDPLVLELLARYPSLSGVSVRSAAVSILDAQSGTRLFDVGAVCAGFPLVLEGEIQVSRESADGRRLELYRVLPGQVCLVSTAALLSNRPLGAQGSAMVDTRVAMISPSLFDQWSNHPPFRQLVFGVFSERLAELMTLVDAVAFQRLDQRLADHLLVHGRILHTTHQALADELGTVREMITRLLNRFETAGVVTLRREQIEIIDAGALRALATGEATSR